MHEVIDANAPVQSPADAELETGPSPSKKAKCSASDARAMPSDAAELAGANLEFKNESRAGPAFEPSSKHVIFIELCAGSAVLSSFAKRKGYSVTPVDYKRNRHEPKCQLVQLDLSKDHAWEVLENIICSCDVVCVHCAPPCGACSRARGIPMPDGSPGPQPLRSSAYPLGVPDMSPNDKAKVDTANRLYNVWESLSCFWIATKLLGSLKIRPTVCCGNFDTLHMPLNMDSLLIVMPVHSEVQGIRKRRS